MRPERANDELSASQGLDRRLAVLVAGTFFMEILDGTILSTAAPAIARSLEVRPASG